MKKGQDEEGKEKGKEIRRKPSKRTRDQQVAAGDVQAAQKKGGEGGNSEVGRLARGGI